MSTIFVVKSTGKIYALTDVTPQDAADVGVPHATHTIYLPGVQMTIYGAVAETGKVKGATVRVVAPGFSRDARGVRARFEADPINFDGKSTRIDGYVMQV